MSTKWLRTVGLVLAAGTLLLAAQCPGPGGGTAFQTLSVASAGTGQGTVVSTPAGIDCGATCSFAFAQNASVTLSATPEAGSTFTSWSGACGGAGTCAVVMDSGKAVTATFTAITTSHTLTVVTSGSGSGTVTSTPAGIDCGTDCSHEYLDGTPVTLTASPAGGSAFLGWGGACSGSASCDLVLTADTVVTAAFELSGSSGYQLNVGRTGTGTGTVTSVPAGISCPPDCGEFYPDGTAVTLTATPQSGSEFTGWSGACLGAGACSLTMSAPRTVTAAFARSWSIAGEIHASGGGPWGDWGPMVYCPSGTYAAGFRIRVEPPQGAGDDTALNAIELVCRARDSTANVALITSSQGTWGTWSSYAYCPVGQSFEAYQLKVEPNQGAGDDTAANSLKMACYGSGAFTWLVPDLQGPWGVWRAAAETPVETAICGIQTRVEAPQGSGDDTALNDVKFAYCLY